MQQRLGRAPYHRGGDGAFPDGQEVVRRPAAVAKAQAAVGHLHTQTDAIAIAPRLACPGLDLGKLVQAGALKNAAQYLAFEFDLRGIVRVLELAAAASAEVLTAGYDPRAGKSECNGRV